MLLQFLDGSTAGARTIGAAMYTNSDLTSSRSVSSFVPSCQASCKMLAHKRDARGTRERIEIKIIKDVHWEGYLANVLASFPGMVGGLCRGRVAATALANKNALPPTCDEDVVPLSGEIFINPVATTLLLQCQPTGLKGFTAWRHPALVRRTAPITAERKDPAMLKKVATCCLCMLVSQGK